MQVKNRKNQVKKRELEKKLETGEYVKKPAPMLLGRVVEKH